MLPTYQLVCTVVAVTETATDKPRRGSAREALLDAAIDVVRSQGLHATTVDDLCTAAGVTKGAFFHHFSTKDDLAVAAAEHWSTTTGRRFAEAAYHEYADPVDRVLGYLDFRATLIQGDPARFSCLVGTMVQEAFGTSSEIRDACARSIFDHAATLEADLAEALAAAGRDPREASGLARHSQAVLQGGFVLAKAAGEPGPALEAIRNLRRYFEFLLHPTAAN